MENDNAAPPALSIDVLRRLEPRHCTFCDDDTVWWGRRLNDAILTFECDRCGLNQRFNVVSFSKSAVTHPRSRCRAWMLQQLVVHGLSYDERADVLGIMFADPSEHVRGAVVQLLAAGGLVTTESVWAAERGAHDSHPDVAAAAATYVKRLRASQQALSPAVFEGLTYEAAVYRLTPTALTRQAFEDELIVQHDPGGALLSVLDILHASGDPVWLRLIVELVPQTVEAMRRVYPTLVSLGGSRGAVDMLLCGLLNGSQTSEVQIQALSLIAERGGPGCMHAVTTFMDTVSDWPRVNAAVSALEALHDRGMDNVGGLSVASTGGGKLTVAPD